MTPDASLAAAFAPTGTLRASINLGNPILAGTDPASTDPASGAPRGVSVDLAAELARRLGVPLATLVFDSAAASVQAVRGQQADIGFFAIDPLRGEGIGFSAPYLLIEGCYLVRAGSALQHNDEVDRPGTLVAVGQGSAYDLYLTRTLKAATIVRAAGLAGVISAFVEQGLEVAAGIKQPLQAEAARRGGLRLLPGRFMVIQQAMGLPQGRGAQALQALAAFVEEMKAGGFVAAALARHGVSGASVAPPAA